LEVGSKPPFKAMKLLRFTSRKRKRTKISDDHDTKRRSSIDQMKNNGSHRSQPGGDLLKIDDNRREESSHGTVGVDSHSDFDILNSARHLDAGQERNHCNSHRVNSVAITDEVFFKNLISHLNIENYEQILRLNHINGSSLVELNDAKLKTMGIKAIGPRVKILNEIARLNAMTKPPIPPTWDIFPSNSIEVRF